MSREAPLGKPRGAFATDCLLRHPRNRKYKLVIESIRSCYSIGHDLLHIPDGVACSNNGAAGTRRLAQTRALAVRQRTMQSARSQVAVRNAASMFSCHTQCASRGRQRARGEALRCRLTKVRPVWDRSRPPYNINRDRGEPRGSPSSCHAPSRAIFRSPLPVVRCRPLDRRARPRRPPHRASEGCAVGS